MLRLIEEAKKGFSLRPSIIQRLQRLAIKDIYTCAGNFRTGPVFIAGTNHQPPDPDMVSEHVEAMCDYVNQQWAESAPLHLAAYLMWRVNWIHRLPVVTDGPAALCRISHCAHDWGITYLER